MFLNTKIRAAAASPADTKPAAASLSSTTSPQQESAKPLVAPLERSTPEAEGVSSEALASLIDALSKDVDSVHSIMVLRHGKVIAEGWWAPYAREDRHTMFSLTKSFTSTAIGLAVAEGRLTLDDPVVKFFPDEVPANASEYLKAMRVRDLLRMTTGQLSTDTAGYNYMGPDSGAARFLALPVPLKPGTHWHYNTPASHMLSLIVQKVTGQSTREYLMPRLFLPLGIPEPVWESTPQGESLGGYGLHLRTEEVAHFGQMLLQRGQWQGRQLVPAAWVDEATAPQALNGSDPVSDWDHGYCYQYWRNTPEGYRADGAFGQFCLVLPKYDAVVITTSGTSNTGTIMKTVWQHLLPACQPSALPANAVGDAALKAKLAALSMPPVAGEALNATAARVSGRRYKLAPDKSGISAIEITFAKERASLTLSYADGRSSVVHIPAGKWDRDNIVPTPFGPAPGACTGAWSSADTFTTRTALTRTPFVITTEFTFTGDSVKVDQVVNVGFGRIEHAIIEGKAD